MFRFTGPAPSETSSAPVDECDVEAYALPVPQQEDARYPGERRQRRATKLNSARNVCNSACDARLNSANFIGIATTNEFTK